MTTLATARGGGGQRDKRGWLSHKKMSQCIDVSECSGK